MPRYILAVLIAFSAALLQAQVVVSPGGYGAQGGALVPIAVPSPPLIFTPSIHLGESPSTSYYANGLAATVPGAAYTEAVSSASSDQVVIVAPPSSTQQASQNFNFGVAQFSTHTAVGGDKTDLAAAARKLKEEHSSVAAKTFTNSDIQRIQQEGAPAANNSNLPNNTAPNAPPK